jgi:hypothetical protein
VTALPLASTPELLTLHAVRLKGMADDDQVAAQAVGWITRVQFASTVGWTLTQAGKAENEQQLATELAATGSASVVQDAYQAFLPLNDRLLRACTDWQLRPRGADPLAANDHTDREWDQRVLSQLSTLSEALRGLCAGLGGRLRRFQGYDVLFASALQRAEQGDQAWVARPRVDSCHTVWMELHEDLMATLGIQRGTEPRS